MNTCEYINIINSSENNLNNVSVKIPKKKITVFTGVSGSGKSSLCLDTIAAESRRELNETFPSFVQQYLPKYGRPDVQKIENLPVTIVLDQKKPTSNSRSTVGTYTDIQPFLRLLFSRVGTPFVGYSDSFSFNHPSGKCKKCDGLGFVNELDIHKLVDFNKCLNDEGVINFPAFTTGAWRWKRYAYSGLFDLDKKIKDYSKEELELFLYSPQIKLKNPPSNWPKSAKFEGIFPRMYRSIINSREGKRHKKTLDKMVTKLICPDCNGARVNKKIRSCLINNKNISEICDLPIPDVIKFIKSIDSPLAVDIKKELIKRLSALVEIGLSYLSLNRSVGSLSGGEAQRIKISKYINSALTDLLYVLDEPSVGLHPHDINLLKKSINKLNKHGNTIIIVEHNKEIINMADYIVELGPKAGSYGGNIVFSGDYNTLIKSDSLTSTFINNKIPVKNFFRTPISWFHLKNINYHNLKNISIELPLGIFTVIAGVAGSGKSSLMDVFEKNFEDSLVVIKQKSIGVNSRSTPSTYLDISDEIRKLFAKNNKVSPSYFSFNSKGACPECKGKGIITSDMSFMDSIETTCELCGGKRYSKEVLKYKYNNKNISEVMDLSISDAIDFFKTQIFIDKLLSLDRVGLGYLHLNQSLSTLSGGELQRIKLASQLDSKAKTIILDEPTDGLHFADVDNLISLFNELVDNGNSLFIIEHNLAVIKSADYIIELGPKGGLSGGEIIFNGTPFEMLSSNNSITKPYL